MKRRSCSGEERSTSSIRSPIRSSSLARSCSMTSAGESPRRRRRAARYTAAGHPSVRMSSAASCSSSSTSPRPSFRKSAISSRPKRRSSARTSITSPCTRIRASTPIPGSRLVVRTTPCRRGSRARNQSRLSRVARSPITRCRSSRTSVVGASVSARVSSSAISTPSRRSASGASAAPRAPASAGPRIGRSALRVASQSRDPSSSASTDTQATRSESGTRLAHWAASVLLPNPAGALITTTCAVLRRIASSRGQRSTCSARAGGRWNLVCGNNRSIIDGTPRPDNRQGGD